MIPEINPEEADPSLPLILDSISVRRLRSLFEVGPIPIQKAMTVLTGENDGGKSTCLDAIALLLDGQQLDDADRSSWCDDDDAIEVEGVFYDLGDKDRNRPFRIRARQELSGGRSLSMLMRRHQHFDVSIADTSLPRLKEQMITAGVQSAGGSAKPPYVKAVEDWLVTRPPEEFEDCWSTVASNVLKRLPRLTRFTAADAQSPTRTLQQVIIREGVKWITQPGYAEPLNDLGRRLNADIAPGLERIKEKLRQHNHDLADIRVWAAFDFSKPMCSAHIEVCRNGAWSDLDKGGEGRKRRMTLAIHEASSALIEEEDEAPIRGDVFIYDEPDTHLDFTSQRTLFDVLDRQSQRSYVQVLVATHSKNFIDMVLPTAILHFRLEDDQRTTVTVLTEPGHEAELAFQAGIFENLGFRNSMLLDERALIVIEGETEHEAIPLLFCLATGKSIVSSAVQLVNTRGRGSIRSVVELLKTEFKRDIVILADTEISDSEDAQRRERWLKDLGLETGNGAYFIGEKEFEDAFSDEIWLHALIEYFPPTKGFPEWTIEDLKGFREAPKFSVAIQLEACRRRREKVGKPDLGLALARACTCIDDVPMVLRECFAAALVLTGRAPLIQ